MSLYDEYRKQRNLSSKFPASTGEKETEKTSIYDQYRMAKGYKTDMNRLKSSLPPALTQQGPDRYMNSTLGRALAGDPYDLDTYQRASGTEIKFPTPEPVQPTQYEINKQKIAKDAANNKFIGAVIAPFSNVMNEALYNNPVGNFITRLGGAAGETATGTPSMAPGDTGNKWANGFADFIGGGVGFVTNPATIGAPGLGMIQSTDRASDALLNTRLGMKAVNTLSKAPAKVFKPETANRITQGFVREGLAGGMQGGTGAWARGEDARGMLEDTLLGGAFGAGGSLLGSALGAGWRAAVNKIKGPKGVQQVEELLALPLGRGDSRMNAAQMRSRAGSNADPIINPSSWKPDPLGLPSGNLAGATKGRIAKTQNIYRQKFENLMRAANQTEFTPGREAEELEGLWASMAERTDPGLSELIDRAYASTRREITPDLMQKARANQAEREMYGVPLPVKSLDERMPRPSVAENAKVTQERLTFPRSERAAGEVEVINPGGNSAKPPGRINQVEEVGAMSSVSPDDFLRRRPGSVQDVPPSEIPSSRTAPDVPEADVPLNYQENYQSAANATKQNWFTNLFGNKGVGISPLGTNRRQGVNPISTEDQIVGNRIRRDAEGTIAEGKAAARAAYHSSVDFLNPIKKISMKAYNQSMDANRANNVANTIINDKFVDPQGRIIGESLKEIFDKVPRGQSKRFVDYLIQRHAVTRMSRGERVYAKNLNMTTEKLERQLRETEIRNPEFKNIADDWNRYNENLLKVYGVDEGLISPQLFNTLRENNPNYAPMQRQFNLSEKFSQPFTMKQNNAFSGQKAPIKEVSPTGSVRNIVDPRRTIIESTGAWVNASFRNRSMQSLIDEVRKNPEALRGVAEIVQSPKGQPNLKQVLSDGDQMDFVNMINDDFNKLFSRTRLDQDNIVRAMYKGEPVYLKIHDPEAVKALAGMGNEMTSVVLDTIGKLSTATKYSATGPFAPMFAIKGFFMDTPQALIQSKNPAMHMVDLGHALISSIADTLPKGTPGVEKIRSLAQDYRRVGGGYSAILRGDRGLKKGISQLNRDPILSPQNVVKTTGKAIAAPFKGLAKFGDIGENLNRIAAYQGELRRRGFERTPENITAALNESREITTNFSRRGSIATQVEKFVPYSNAAMQGLRRFVVQWKQNPVKTMALVGGTILLPKALELMSHYDDPDYQNIPAREKYRNLILGKTEDGKFNKVPIPMEYGAMGGLFADILESVYLDDPQAFKGSAEALVNAFLPPQLSGPIAPLARGEGLEQMIVGGLNSTVAAPFVATAANIDYAGRPIESRALEGNSPVNRYDERTSKVAIEIAKYTNMSPKKIDYLIRSYGGDPARLLLPLTSEAGQGDVKGALLKNFIVDPQYTNTLSTDYYLYKERMEQTAKDFKDGKANLPSWFSDTLKETISTTKKGSFNKRLSDLSQQKREIQADKTITPKLKTERLREIQYQMNDIYMTVNQMMEEAGVPLR